MRLKIFLSIKKSDFKKQLLFSFKQCNIWQPQNMMCCLLRSTKLCWDETLLNWSIEKISNNFFKPQWKKPTSFEADVLFLFFIWSVVNAICTQWSKIENVIWNSRVNKDQFCILMLFSSHFGNLVFGCFCQWMINPLHWLKPIT